MKRYGLVDGVRFLLLTMSYNSVKPSAKKPKTQVLHFTMWRIQSQLHNRRVVETIQLYPRRQSCWLVVLDDEVSAYDRSNNGIWIAVNESGTLALQAGVLQSKMRCDCRGALIVIISVVPQRTHGMSVERLLHYN